jgi:redox-sensitive bicupin YhaK (pirin superfamily)
MKEREIQRVLRGIATRDGAGVKLNRIFGFQDTEESDPFLLLDEFGSTRVEDYIKGFPWHPHRGIETVTYLIDGTVAHGDSLGNSGVIGPGDLQWMTAGSGIIHEEMPQESPGGVRGFQLWVNLAAAEKMCAPAYHGVLAAEVPVLALEGAELRVIAGDFGGVRGPIAGIARDPLYLDVALDAGASIRLPTKPGTTAFACLSRGSLVGVTGGSCAFFGPGEVASLRAGPEGARFIFAAALPLREPVAWGGPIVMNTKAELEKAFEELEDGTFIKAGPSA